MGNFNNENGSNHWKKLCIVLLASCSICMDLIRSFFPGLVLTSFKACGLKMSPSSGALC